MTQTNVTNWLQGTADQIRMLESQAVKLLSQNDAEGYNAKMKEKAELLSGLFAQAQLKFRGINTPLAQRVLSTIEGFSDNAARSLKIGSVFYMSALLYPEDYVDGQPNNLELLIAEIKNQL